MRWKTLLVVGSWLVASPLTFAQDVQRDAVLLINVADISGSMARAVEAMARVEAGQIQRTMRPGDIYVRIPFTTRAEVTMLHRVATMDDVERIAEELEEPLRAGGDTAISRGLMLAREVVNEQADGRRIVLVLTSDGENDPDDSMAAEEARLDEVAEWWRTRPDATRVVVGVLRDRNRQNLERLATALGARLVLLDEYSSFDLVERAIVDARALAVPVALQAPVLPEVPVPDDRMHSSVWMGAAVIVAVVVVIFLAVSYRHRAGTVRPVRQPQRLVRTVGVVHRPDEELLLTVTANGQPRQTVIPITEMAEGTVTLGTAGDVGVPGLAGSPLTLQIGADGVSVSEDPGTGILFDGAPLAGVPQPVRAGRTGRLTFRGVSIHFQLRRGGEARARPRLRIASSGRQ